jgi:hypothetical protein
MTTGNSVTAPARSSSLVDQPALLCFALFAVLAVLSYLLALIRFGYWLAADELTLEVTSRDFANYWMGARLVLSGEQQQLFAWGTYFPRMQEVFGSDYPIHNWGYPPHSLLLLWPLGYLEYRPAMLVFLGVSFLMFVAAVVCFRREYAASTSARMLSVALVGYVLTVIYTTQNGFLSAAAALFGLATMKRHPVLAGLAFALLTIKPQLGFLIPVLLLFDRNWRALAWSTLFTVLLLAASIVCFGAESWYAYLTDTLRYQRFVMVGWEGIFLRMMPTPFGSIRTLGFAPHVAEYVQWPVSIAGAVLVVWLLWRETDPLRRAFAMLCGTLLITPYALNYDMGALSVAAALLALGGSLQGRAEILIISVVAAISGAVMNLGLSRLPITPLILAAGLLVVVRHAGRDSHRQVATPL